MVESTMKEGLVTFNQARSDAGLVALKPGQVLGVVEEIAQRANQVGIPEIDFPCSDPPANLEYVGALLPRPNRAAGNQDHIDFSAIFPDAEGFPRAGGYGVVPGMSNI